MYFSLYVAAVLSSGASAGAVLSGPLTQVPPLGLLCCRLVGLRVGLVVVSLRLCRLRTGPPHYIAQNVLRNSSSSSPSMAFTVYHCIPRQFVPGVVHLLPPFDVSV